MSISKDRTSKYIMKMLLRHWFLVYSHNPIIFQNSRL